MIITLPTSANRSLEIRMSDNSRVDNNNPSCTDDKQTISKKSNVITLADGKAIIEKKKLEEAKRRLYKAADSLNW